MEADHKVSQFSPNELLQVHADPTHKRLQELFYCELYQIIPLVQKKQQQRRLELNVGLSEEPSEKQNVDKYQRNTRAIKGIVQQVMTKVQFKS